MNWRKVACSALLAVVLVAGCSQKQPAPERDNAAKASPKTSPKVLSGSSSPTLAEEPAARVASKVGPSVVQISAMSLSSNAVI